MLYRSNSNLSFNVAVINQSKTSFAADFVSQAESSKLFKISETINTLDAAQEKMKRSELDAAILVPKDFGTVKNDKYPTGNITVYYNENAAQAGQTLTSVLQQQFSSINARYVSSDLPFKIIPKSTNTKGLKQFDYAFAGLLGFSIIGLGIFGPVNVFPELKKQGILRRLHTTPLRVWQYFVANVISQAVIGLFAIAILFATAVAVFDLQMMGNYLSFVVFILLGIFTIYGIGLAIGGWAKNERQAAPLGNLITFPMMFLSGTFFPRFLMPDWLQHVSAYLPLTPVVDGIRLIVTEGKNLIDVAPQLGLMAVWAVVIYIIAFRIFRWE